MKPIGAVLVVGGGVAGMQAALNLAAAGIKVYLVEKSPSLGGRAARLASLHPQPGPAMCSLSPLLIGCAQNANVEIITQAELRELSGEAGHFLAKIWCQARYVDLAKCNGCGYCLPGCPVTVRREGLEEPFPRKAIYGPFPEAIPNAFAIEKKGIPPCEAACPVGVEVQRYVALIAQGRYDEASRVIREQMPFPSICGRICYRSCEAECNLGRVDEPVAIMYLKRFAADYAFQNRRPLPAKVGKTQMAKIAIVGGGLSGLAAAQDLAKMGYPVTVFEVRPFLGGELRIALPSYRLPKDMLDWDIQHILALGMEVRLNTAVSEESLATKQIGPERYEAIFLATGVRSSRGRSRPAEGVIAEGDLIRGSAWTVDVVAAGHQAAALLDRYLRGKPDTGESLLPPVVKLPKAELEEKISRGELKLEPPVPIPTVSPNWRESTPLEMDRGFTEEEAQREAGRCLSCGGCAECLDCVLVCPQRAVNHAPHDSARELEVGAVILAPGSSVYDPRPSKEFGFGQYANVVTSLQFERLLSPSGPTRGLPLRLSDREKPRRVAFLDIPEKDKNFQVARRAYLVKEARLAQERLPKLECYFFDTAEADSPDQPEARAPGLQHVTYRHLSVSESPENKNLVMKYEIGDGEVASGEFDLVVLGVGLTPPEGAQSLAAVTSTKLREDGFCETSGPAAVETSRPGVYACGTFTGAKGVAESLAQGKAAAAVAVEILGEARNTLIKEPAPPAFIKPSPKELRLGVFLCHCGLEVESVLDMPHLLAFTVTLPGVVHVADRIYACSADSLRRLQESLADCNLNRVVIAGCDSPSHQALFQEALRQAGLNPSFAQMVDWRELCRLHRAEPEKAVEEAKQRLKTAVERARFEKSA